MEHFNFFMIFYSLLLGLAVTEMFGSVGVLLRQEQFSPRKLPVLVPLLVILVFVDIMTAFIDAWDRLQNVRLSLEAMFLPALIGTSYFVLTTIAFPRTYDEWSRFDEYFAQRRRRIAGVMLFINLLILAQEPAFLICGWNRGEYAGIGTYIAGNMWLFLWLLILWVKQSHRSAIAALLSILAFYVLFYVGDITGLFAGVSC